MNDEEPGWELPEYRDNPFIARLPPILSEDEAIKALSEPPLFHVRERQYPDHIRTQCIMRLSRYFEPLNRHLKLEQSFSTLLRQGYLGRNPTSGTYLRHLQDAHERTVTRDLYGCRNPLPSTAFSFALVGCSGIGKTKTVERILGLYSQVIHHPKPFSFDQIVWLKLDSPHLGSPKQLCINFFHAIDLLLGTSYLHDFRRMSLDEMMVRMTQVTDLHALGVLVVDEIQHLNQARGTAKEELLNFLVTLVNTIGIPVLLIGTMGAVQLLQGDFRQARRASGLGSMVWERLARTDGWDHFVDRMWRFQWTQEQTPLTNDLCDCLYEESQGIIDVVIKLFMLAQLQAIQLRRVRGRPETLDVKLLQHVARENFKLIAPMIGALKRGDREAIAKYDDIRPFHDHVGQLFHQAMTRLEPSGRAPIMTSSPSVPLGSSDDDQMAQVRVALEGLSVAPDVADGLLAAAVAQVGEGDALALMAAVMAQLQQAPPVSPAPRKRAQKKPVPVMDDADLRSMVERGKAAQKAGYDALLEADIIRPVISDFAV